MEFVETRNRWFRLCKRLGIEHNEIENFVKVNFWWDFINRQYDLNRFYHNIDHINECLECLDEFWFEKVLGNQRKKDIVEFAIWFHDIIYDNHKKDNEEKSANQAILILEDLGLANEKTDSDCVGTIREWMQRLIMATCHNEEVEGTFEELISDIDMMILGSSNKKYDKYAEQVRKEYAWILETEWKTARTMFLVKLLNSKRIFYSQYFYELYEEKAKENISIEIKKLTT